MDDSAAHRRRVFLGLIMVVATLSFVLSLVMRVGGPIDQRGLAIALSSFGWIVMLVGAGLLERQGPVVGRRDQGGHDQQREGHDHDQPENRPPATRREIVHAEPPFEPRTADGRQPRNVCNPIATSVTRTR